MSQQSKENARNRVTAYIDLARAAFAHKFITGDVRKRLETLRAVKTFNLISDFEENGERYRVQISLSHIPKENKN